MGTAAQDLIKGIAISEVNAKLDSFYAYEMTAMHWTLAVQNRLAGMALVLINNELSAKSKVHLARAQDLADRMAQLGGAVTGNPSQFVNLAPIDSFQLPDNGADMRGIIQQALVYEHQAIAAYGQFLTELNGKDPITYHLILGILKYHIETEDELEATLET